MEPVSPQFSTGAKFINPETLDEQKNITSPYANQVNVNPAETTK